MYAVSNTPLFKAVFSKGFEMDHMFDLWRWHFFLPTRMSYNACSNWPRTLISTLWHSVNFLDSLYTQTTYIFFFLRKQSSATFQDDTERHDRTGADMSNHCVGVSCLDANFPPNKGPSLYNAFRVYWKLLILWQLSPKSGYKIARTYFFR